MTPYDKKSPYSATLQPSRYVQYLDYWVPPSLTVGTDDQTIIVSSKYKHRPDLLSYDYYGTPKLWWIFAAYNPSVIKDPIYDLVAGMNLYVPAKSSLSGVI